MRTNVSRRMLFRAGGTLFFLVGFSAVVNAAPPHTFASGETLTAANLNQNFTSLDARITKLETPAPVGLLESVSIADQTGTAGTPHVFTAATVTLTPGTWLIEAHATVRSTVQPDYMQLGLQDATNGAPIAGSRSGVAESTPAGNPVALSTSKVLTVTANTDIRMVAYPNGNGTPNFSGTSLSLPERQRLFAVKLR